MRKLFLFAVVGCGFTSYAFAQENLNVYQGSEKLRLHKNQVIQACKDLGCTDLQKATFLAMGMLESEEFCSSQRDCTKDGDAMCKNFSAFNMNGDFLQMLGIGEEEREALNREDNIANAVRILILAENTWGIDKVLAFHRGGRTAFNDGVSYGAQDFIVKIKATAQHLLQNPQLMADNNRVAYCVPHV